MSKSYLPIFLCFSMVLLAIYVTVQRYAPGQDTATYTTHSTVFGVKNEKNDNVRNTQDFAQHIALAKIIREQAAEKGILPYTNLGQLQLFQIWLGQKDSDVAAWAYAPLITWITYPLQMLDAPLGYIVYVMACFSTFMVLSQIYILPKLRTQHAMFIVFVLNASTLTAVMLGHTPLVILPILLYVALESVSTWAGILILVFVSFKPTYYILFAGIFLLRRNYIIFIAGSCIMAAGNLAALYSWGNFSDQLNTYVLLMKSYNSDQAPESVRQCAIMVQCLQNNTSTFLLNVFKIPITKSCAISLMAWASSIVILYAIPDKILIPKDKKVALMILSFQIFCPHLVNYEDLLLIPVFALLLRINSRAFTSRWHFLAALIALNSTALSHASTTMGILKSHFPYQWLPIMFFYKIYLVTYTIQLKEEDEAVISKG